MLTNISSKFFFVIFGLVLIVFGFISLKESKEYKDLTSNGVRVEGKIVDITFDGISIKDVKIYPGNTEYYPIVEFIYQNKSYKTTSIHGAKSRAAYSIGDRLYVIFPKDQPDKAVLEFTIKDNPPVLGYGLIITGGLVAVISFVVALRK